MSEFEIHAADKIIDIGRDLHSGADAEGSAFGGNFRDVAVGSPHWRMKSSGMMRDSATDARSTFVVDDGTYVSARWPGDTHTFAATVATRLDEAG